MNIHYVRGMSRTLGNFPFTPARPFNPTFRLVQILVLRQSWASSSSLLASLPSFPIHRRANSAAGHSRQKQSDVKDEEWWRVRPSKNSEMRGQEAAEYVRRTKNYPRTFR